MATQENSLRQGDVFGCRTHWSSSPFFLLFFLPSSIEPAYQSFLLAKLKAKIQAPNTGGPPPTVVRTLCCCMVGFWRVISESVLGVVFKALCKELWSWLQRCRKACCPSRGDVNFTGGGGQEDGMVKKGSSHRRKFIVVDFNAWECAGSEVLWASVITKIFDEVLSRGHVLKKVLQP